VHDQPGRPAEVRGRRGGSDVDRGHPAMMAPGYVNFSGSRSPS
jgi:hypothetical protein